MNTHKLPPIFMFSIIIFLDLAISTKSLPNFLYQYCPNTTTYTTNSTYQKNLKTLLTSLSSNSTLPGGFYNTFVNPFGEVIYGLFLCRGDVSPDTCNDCVTTATKEALQRCPNNKVVILWYDQCLLRYSNKTTFSKPNGHQPGVYMWNTKNVTLSEQSRFNALVSTTLTSAASEATDVPSGVSKKYFTVEETSGVSKKYFKVKEKSGASKYFKVKEASEVFKKNVKLKETSGNGNFSEFDHIYTLVQCTQDLSASDCESCLEEIIGKFPLCCEGKLGGRVLFPSCNFRYEMYRFYNVSAVAVSAPSLSPVVVVPPPREQPGKGGISTITIVAIVTPIGVFMLLFCVGYCFLSKRSRRKSNVVNEEDDGANGITTVESLQYDLGTIKTATNNFSEENKLGEGGFGDVYKGTLANGQEIAVKRLSSRSMQGALEFKNEVILVAKLQHRHLVRLLGFCLDGEEKILVYEFVPNKSLDYFLFDPEKQGLLYWSQRYKIIGGIARGILYLHQDSRLRIIHRDLKASNILLDGDMKPKISDFGMAKIFGVDQTQGNTNRIVGTYGYMSPEYAMHGQFSVKSDIYSFGILVLEIITGKKNNSFYQADGCQDLVSYVWKHWRDETPLEVLDPALGDAYSRNEVVRCIQIGLLCVQENPADRPSMASVVLMLNSYSVSMPLPQQPAFFISRPFDSFKLSESDQSKSKSVTCSVDEELITEVYPR